MEIEKKWLVCIKEENYIVLNRLKEECEFVVEKDIFQYFLSSVPYVRVQREFNISNETTKDVLCIKGAGSLSRVEVEKDLSNQECLDLLKLVEGKSPILKNVIKFRLPNTNVILEYHTICFKDEFRFAYIEVEFKTEEDASTFSSDILTGLIEVTGVDEYYMNNVWEKFQSEVN